MMDVGIILGGLIVTIVIVTILYKVNYKEGDRYKQLWAPIAAFVFFLAVVHLNILHFLPFMDMIYERFPSLLYYAALVVNVVLLLLFFGVKLVLKIGDLGIRFLSRFVQKHLRWLTRVINWCIAKLVRLLPRKWRYRFISSGRKDRSVSIFYESGYDGITLKPQWYYVSLFFRYTSILAIGIFLLYVVLLPFELKGQIAVMLPAYPAVSLLVFLELAWFFGGKTQAYGEEVLSGEDAHAERISNYNDLYEAYEELWPDKLLVKDKRRMSPAHYLEKTNGDYNFFTDAKTKSEEHLRLILKRLREAEIPLREPYVEMLEATLSGKDVLVEDPLYGELTDFLIPAIINRLINHHRIVFVVKDRRSVADTEAWLKEGFRDVNGLEYLWSIGSLKKAYEDNITPHILIIQMQEAQQLDTVQFLTERFQGISYDTFIFFEAERLMAVDTPELRGFVGQLTDGLRRKPVFWIFSQWYEGLEAAVRQTFSMKPEDILAKPIQSPSLHYMVWKLEGTRFQNVLFPRLSHRFISGEAVLATVAQQFEVGEMQFVNQEGVAVKESIADLLDNKEHLLHYGLSESQIRRMKRHAHVYDQYWSVPATDHAFLFVRDVNYNLVDTLSHWWSSGKISTFAHILSPPYLLRDYLAANISFHMISSRTVSPLSPKQPGTPFGRLKPLLDRLINGFVPEEEVREALSVFSYPQDLPVVDQLHQALVDKLGADVSIKEVLKVRQKRIFNEQRKVFQKEVSYNITTKLAAILPLEGKQSIRIRKQSGEIIDTIPAGYSSQRYLPGQEHTFAGELYKIDNIFPELGMMEVSFSAQKNSYLYKQNRLYELDSNGLKNGSVRKKQFMNGTFLEMSIFEPPFQVTTKGYLRFNKHVNLNPGESDYIKLEEQEKRYAERAFKKGIVFKLDISLKDKLSNQDAVAFTLSFLLNELFMTLYPHSHDYIKATTVLPDDFFAGLKALENDRGLIVKQLYPKLELVGEGEKSFEGPDAGSMFSVYILEDSPTQLGLVESLQENIKDVWQLLYDYLLWVDEDEAINSSYLKLGLDELLPFFDLSGTRKVLQSIVSTSKLQTAREQDGKANFEAIEELQNKGEKRTCAFCGKTYLATQYEVLEDHRDRCRECEETAVNEVSKLRPMYEQTRNFFMERYGIDLRKKGLKVSMVNADTLAKASGLPFVPGQKARVVGKASVQDNNEICVMMENGTPKLMAYMTLAHELVHVWQFDNLNYHFMTLEELEGFATWVEIDFALYFGEKVHADKFIEELRQRNDAYSNGYFQLVEMLEATAGIDNPFQLFSGR